MSATPTTASTPTTTPTTTSATTQGPPPTGRFEVGVNVRATASPEEFARVVRRADELGFDVLAAPDHLGGQSPFVSLAAAAVLSDRLRLRTYVLDAAFWNPALLARDVATLDVLSGGRAELGLGAGHVRREHEEAGVGWQPLAGRVRWMEELLVRVRERLADPAVTPRPVQQPVPVVVGAMSEAGLRVAARHADVVALAGARQAPGRPTGELAVSSEEELLERADLVRRLADGRPHRTDLLLQLVRIDPDPEALVARWCADEPWVDPARVLASPVCLVAPDVVSAAAELRRLTGLLGLTGVVTHQSELEGLGAVAAELRRDAAPA